MLYAYSEDAAAPTAAAATAGGAGSDMVDDEDLAAAIAMSVAGEGAPSTGPSVLATAGLPAKFKGMYELFGVVTHKGRSADAGHYIGWVKAKGGAYTV